MHLFILCYILNLSGVCFRAQEGFIDEVSSIARRLVVVDTQTLNEGRGSCGGKEWHDDDKECYQESVKVEHQQPAHEAEI